MMASLRLENFAKSFSISKPLKSLPSARVGPWMITSTPSLRRCLTIHEVARNLLLRKEILSGRVYYVRGILFFVLILSQFSLYVQNVSYLVRRSKRSFRLNRYQR